MDCDQRLMILTQQSYWIQAENGGQWRTWGTKFISKKLHIEIPEEEWMITEGHGPALDTTLDKGQKNF